MSIFFALVLRKIATIPTQIIKAINKKKHANPSAVKIPVESDMIDKISTKPSDSVFEEVLIICSMLNENDEALIKAPTKQSKTAKVKTIAKNIFKGSFINSPNLYVLKHIYYIIFALLCQPLRIGN